MKYINLMGQMSNLDVTIEKYLSRYDIQLEYTMRELAKEKGLSPIVTPNPYVSAFKTAERVYKVLDLREEETDADIGYPDMSLTRASEVVLHAADYLDNTSAELNRTKARLQETLSAIEAYTPFGAMRFEVSELQGFDFLVFRFGKMPLNSFKQFEAFIYKDAEILFVEAKRDSEHIWGAYFATAPSARKVDSMFSSLYFEKIDIPFVVNGLRQCGPPAEIVSRLEMERDKLSALIARMEKDLMARASLAESGGIDRYEIRTAYYKLKNMYYAYDTRKFGAKTVNDFFIFVGWMTEEDADQLDAQTHDDGSVVLIVLADDKSIPSRPPTKLNNNAIFKPFEFFVKMYGLPNYEELDPTPFVAISYTILFGVMFGDIGQGFVLSLLGFILYFRKKFQLGGIMGIIGISSMVFGGIFGSVFGLEFEGLFKPSRPDNINSVLMYAVVFGVFMILTSLAFNIYNGIKTKNYKSIIFDPNGVIGFLFYGGVVVVAANMLLDNIRVPLAPIIAVIAVLLVLLLLREPILAFLNRKKRLIHEGVGLYLFQAVIELFEIILSYFTNTVSFMRVGAFALSHAAMMGIVTMLAGVGHANEGGTPNILVMIGGNLLVMGLEGLIVGIQVLRIEFYEMFSRFYGGKGREFKPYRKIQ